MKITKIVNASKEIVRAKSTDDMLKAFEDRLSDFGIESNCKIESSDLLDGDVDINGEDYNEFYEDVGAAFGEPGAIYSLAEIKTFWNEDRESDPVVSMYNSFDKWWNDTKSNFLERYYKV